MNLTEFLIQRIDQDERDARKLTDTDHRPVLSLAVTVNHPQRLLSESAMKRQIVELHSPYHVTTKNDGLNWDYRGCSECSDPEDWEPGRGDWWPCLTLQLLAMPYADHPDYPQLGAAPQLQ